MNLWKIAIWVVGTLGIAGTVTVILLYPLIARAIGARLIRFFTFVLYYRTGCALIAAILAGLAVDYWRHSRDDAEYEQRTALFEHAQAARDEKIKEETRQAVWIEIANETAANTATDNEVKEFTHELRPLPATDTNCRVGAAVDKLHIIAGQIDRGHRGNKGMPKARRHSPGPGF